MKTFSRYVCEICGTDYAGEAFARWCEEAPALPECPVKSGDAVRVYERYGEPEADEVVSVRVAAMMDAGMFDQWHEYAGDEHVSGGFDGFMKRTEGKGPFFSEPYVSRNHTYLVKVKNDHQMSKDENSYTDEIHLDNLAVNDIWVTGTYAGQVVGQESLGKASA